MVSCSAGKRLLCYTSSFWIGDRGVSCCRVAEVEGSIFGWGMVVEIRSFGRTRKTLEKVLGSGSKWERIGLCKGRLHYDLGWRYWYLADAPNNLMEVELVRTRPMVNHLTRQRYDVFYNAQSCWSFSLGCGLNCYYVFCWFPLTFCDSFFSHLNRCNHF